MPFAFSKKLLATRDRYKFTYLLEHMLDRIMAKRQTPYAFDKGLSPWRIKMRLRRQLLNQLNQMNTDAHPPLPNTVYLWPVRPLADWTSVMAGHKRKFNVSFRARMDREAAKREKEQVA